MFLYLSCIVIFLCFMIDHLKRRKILACANNLPSSKLSALPLVGHTHHFIGSDEDRMQTLQKLGKDSVENGGMAIIWFGRRSILMVTDAEVGAFILKTCLQKGELMKYIRDLIGNGSFVADVPIWRRRRKVLAPAFTPKILKQFTDIFSKHSEVMVQQLQKVNGTGDFEMWKYLAAYSMDAVSESNLGVKVSAQTNKTDHVFIESLGKLTQITAQRMLQPWLQVEFIYKLSSHFRNNNMYLKKIIGFIDEIIQTKRNEMQYAEKKLNDNTDGKPEHGFKTFLEMLIENSGGPKGYSDIELREEILVIAMAGTDTSGAGSCFTFSMLAKHPQIQEKVYKEICEVTGGSDRALTHEDLTRLTYLEAVIKESLRLYPPLPVIMRNIDKEVILPTGHTLIPGFEVCINIWALHRNPKYWGEDAEIFRPERFMDSKLIHPAAFMPFSHGPRNCVGYQYAMMAMKIAIASVLRRYRIMRSTNFSNIDTSNVYMKSQEYERVKFDIMMKDVSNVTVRIENREKN